MTEVDVDAQPIPEDPAPATPEDHGRGGIRNVVEWIAIIVGALAVALIVKTFLIQAFFIPSL